MMTATIRSLALLSVCCGLWGGCSEQAPAKKSAPALRSEAVPLRPIAPAEPTPNAATLSATTQDRPASVADLALPAHQPEPAASADKTETTQDSTTESAQASTSEFEPKEPTDFDRELDPSEVRIDRFVLAAGVAEREPVGESDTFASDTKEIYAFVQLANPSAPYALRVHWEKAEGPASAYGFKMEVPTAPRWRTWSWTRIQREPGQYRAVLRTLQGVEVASRAFEIVPH